MEEALPRGDLLTIILDCNPFWWGKSVSTTDSGLLSSSSAVVGGNEISNVLSHCLNSVLALANAHLLFDANNQVAIIASYNNQTKFLRLVSICGEKDLHSSSSSSICIRFLLTRWILSVIKRL